MKACLEFKEGRKTSFARESCIRCGLPFEAHALVLYFNDKIYYFKNWEEARKKGFYPG